MSDQEAEIRRNVEFLAANLPSALDEELVQARLELSRLQGENDFREKEIQRLRDLLRKYGESGL